MVAWGEAKKRRLVVEAETEDEAAILRDFKAKAKRDGRTIHWLIFSWMAAYLIRKESRGDENH